MLEEQINNMKVSVISEHEARRHGPMMYPRARIQMPLACLVRVQEQLPCNKLPLPKPNYLFIIYTHSVLQYLS